MKLNLAVVLLGLSALPALANAVIQNIEVVSGENVTLPCQMQNGYSRCEWVHNGVSLYSEHPASADNPVGRAIVGDPSSGNCSLQITSIKLEDAGQWTCAIPRNTGKNLVELTVLVSPSSSSLSHDGRLLNDGEVIVVKPDPTYGHVIVRCLSARAKPAPTIAWEVNGVAEESDEAPRVNLNSDLQTVNVSSTLTLQFAVFTQNNTAIYQLEPNSTKEKRVRCILRHKAYKQPAVLTAVLQMEYATTTCQLTVHYTSGNDSEALLVCEGDGVPEPSYTIHKIRPSTDIIESVFVGQNHTVTEGGVYLCEATYQESHSVQSTQVRVILHEDHTTRSVTTAKTTRVWTRKTNSASPTPLPRTAMVSALALTPFVLGPLWLWG